MGLTVLVNDGDALRRAAVSEIESRSVSAIVARGTFTIALPGGSVAAELFPPLAASAVEWQSSDLFWIDERAVLPDDPDSNYALALALLLRPAGIPVARVHRMRGEMQDLDEAARQYGDALTQIVGDPPRLDLALVGVGEDGHIASIFPGSVSGSTIGSAGLQPCIAVHNAPKPPPRRLSLTLPVIARARRLVLAAFGEPKASVIRDALEHDDAATPVAELLRRSVSALVLLDRKAASLLS